MRLDPKAWEMGHSPRGFKVDWFQIVHKCTVPNLVLNKDRWGPWWFRMDSKWYGWYGYDMMWMSKELRSIIYLSTWINDFGPLGSEIHPTSLILSWGTAFFRTFRCRSFRPGIVLRKNNEAAKCDELMGKKWAMFKILCWWWGIVHCPISVNDHNPWTGNPVLKRSQYLRYTEVDACAVILRRPLHKSVQQHVLRMVSVRNRPLPMYVQWYF